MKLIFYSQPQSSLIAPSQRVSVPSTLSLCLSRSSTLKRKTMMYCFYVGLEKVEVKHKGRVCLPGRGVGPGCEVEMFVYLDLFWAWPAR